MSEKDFCVWLDGFLEITRAIKIEPSELEVIKKRLDVVLRGNKKVNCNPDFEPASDFQGRILLKDAIYGPEKR
jgi:hypothetical protein